MSASIFQAFASLKVMVVGDIMLDRYVYGKATRISPEAPVPVLEYQSETQRLGGAANVALNLAALGARPILCGLIGADAEGESLQMDLKNAGISTDGLMLSVQRRTTIKTRYIAGTQQIMRLDKEECRDLSEEESDRFLQLTNQLIRQEAPDCLIFQDYNKGVLTNEVIAQLVQTCKRLGIVTAVDPKYRNFWSYQGADVFKPNLREVQDALGQTLSVSPSSLNHAANLLRSKLSCKLVLITLSEHGLFLGDDSLSQIYPTRQRTVADVCGAGDTVISIAALAYTLGLDKARIALLANLAGGQVVEKMGVVAVDKGQLEAELAQYLA